MADTACNIVASHLTGLAITNAVCVALGTTLEFGYNIHIGIGPATSGDTLTITPYGGSPPNLDGYRQNAEIQIQSKTDNRKTALELQQSLINELHVSELSGNGKVFAKQSAPILLGTIEGGEHTLAVSNYNIKHVKI